MHTWTASAHCARHFRTLVRQSGSDSPRFDALPGLAPRDLGDDLIRVPMASVVALCEQLIVDASGPHVALRAADAAPVGAFGLWDYLATCGPDLRTTIATAVDYLHLVGDADTRIQGSENGSLYTIRQSVTVDTPDVAEAFDLMALAIFLRRAREASRAPLVPLKLTLTHRAPTRIRRHAEHFGTRNIEFGAEANTVTLLLDDVVRTLPGSQPGLDRVLRDHADRTLAATRTVPTGHDRFTAALEAAFRDDEVSLDRVAQRLGTSGRTLQRRLAALGTSWRAEVEAARERQALALLRDTDLPLRDVAAKLGYTDARTLRRAMLRWQSTTPSALRARGRDGGQSSSSQR
ncbi:AraC family transcriptional regulator [Yinghuangia soli]|uniref:AraC family transcriptional regulator n=1 Tax=Yinghuangia soli TaxID=2908204 RepID=A0AA41Q7F5_9ACTN|nr:AraC family transcriptional regulator [Yinghuangia soli]MCF2531567.1 AraC family transcriptional regulator [Yinghuangia soli]